MGVYLVHVQCTFNIFKRVFYKVQLNLFIQQEVSRLTAISLFVMLHRLHQIHIFRIMDTNHTLT